MKILILFQLISVTLSEHQLTSLDWKEPMEVMMLVQNEVFKTTEAPKGNFDKNHTGQLAELGQFPHYVLLLLKKSSAENWESYGATIIHPSYILTTAANLIDCHQARAFAGLIDRRTILTAEYSSGEIYNNSFQIHPNFDANNPGNFNVALIKICRGIRMSVNVGVARLPGEKEEGISLNERVAVLPGFNEKCGEDGAFSKFLTYFKQPILSKNLCLEKYDTKFNTEEHFCVRSKAEAGGCWNDLSGSMILNIDGEDFVFGLFYNLKKTFTPGYPAIFIDVRPFVSWIKSTVEESAENNTEIFETTENVQI